MNARSALAALVSIIVLVFGAYAAASAIADRSVNAGAPDPEPVPYITAEVGVTMEPGDDNVVTMVTVNGEEQATWYEGVADAVLLEGPTREAVCADLELGAGECADFWTSEDIVAVLHTNHNEIYAPILVQDGLAADGIVWQTNIEG